MRFFFAVKQLRKFSAAFAAIFLLFACSPAFSQISGKTVTVSKSSIIDFKTIEAYNRAHPYDPNERRIAGIMNGSGEEEEEMPKMKVPRNAKVMTDPFGKMATVNSRDNSSFSSTTTSSPAPGITFNGIDDNITAIPPDVGGQVGPNHVMTALNSQLRISTRTGAVIGTVTLNAFFASLGNPSTFDPKLLYDPYNNRWILTACANGGAATSAVLTGVSQTNDPTGTWNLYSTDADATDVDWFDYPSMGFNKDWIVVGGNMFTRAGNSFTAGKLFVYKKADLYAGVASPAITVINAGTNGFTICPAVTYDNIISTLYLTQNYNGNSGGNGFIGFYTITGSIGSEVLSAATLVSTPNPWSRSASVANFAPQAGTANKVDCNDSRMQKTIYRNGKIWCTHSVFLPAGATTRSAVQWWQLSPAAAVLQRGRIDDPTGATFYAFPSIDVNQNDDALIGCAKFNAGIFPSACYALRMNTDPVNTFQNDYVYKAGLAKYYKTYGGASNRWGDYTSVCVDPTDNLSFWTVQEYAMPPTGGYDAWGTWWANIDPYGCQPVPAASSVAVCYLGSAVLTAPCNCGTTKWYDSTGTILLATGATYTPTNITAPVLFKARCEDQSGASSFVNVNVTLSSPPVYVTASAPLDFCNGDSVVLNSNIGVNNAINFVKASSQYITVPHSPSLNLASNFTIEAWVNYSGINSTIVDKGNYDFLFQLNANGNLNKLGFYDRGGAAWIYSTDPVPQNTWTHVALTRNGNIITFYINGLASGSGTATGISQDALPMNIGRQQPSACQCNFFNGQMDELRIWNTTLTQPQIQARMKSSVPVNSTGLAAYYKFDEDAGTVTADATPNGNNGTLVNAPTRVVPSAAPINTEFGNALTFIKASSQYITVPHSTSIDLGGNYTIEVWINYSGLNSTIIDKGNNAYLFQVGANSNANKLGFYDRGAAAWIYSTGSIPQNTWTHVALRRTANVISFYINSIPAGSATVGVIYQDALAMNIGRQQPSACQCNYFNGAMDELRIWNVARTPAEIAANYYRSVAVNSPGLAAYYKFDEGTGTLTADATANGNNGTLVTGQVWQNPSGLTPPAITWTPGGAHTGTLTVKTTGTYMANYNMPGGCISNVSVNVTARAKPTLGPDITLYKDCVGDTTNLTGLFNTTGLFPTWNTANPISVLPGTYRLIALNAQNSSCADTAYANIILEVATWTGAISGNWHIAGNWSIGKVPTAKTHVIFPPGTPVCFISANAFAASIQVKNTNSVTVNTPYQLFIGGKCMVLPVIDNVRPALSTSITAYDNAVENSWVSVTQAEYNNLLTTVSGSAKYGSSESYMLTTPNNQWTGGYMVGGNPNPAKVPPSNYIIAWSVKTGVSASSALNSKLKVSASQTSGYADYGSALPDIGTIPANTRVFFVLKKPLVVTPASPAFTAVYNVTSGFLGATSGAGYGPEYFQGSDVSFFNSGSGAFDAYSQVICTGVRQW